MILKVPNSKIGCNVAKSECLLPTMRRTVIEGQGMDNPNIDTTPLRGSLHRLPRLRLLDKHFKPEDDPVLGSYWEYKSLSAQDLLWLDRFIPRRSAQDFEASNFLLTKDIVKCTKKNHLDVLEQENSPAQADYTHTTAKMSGTGRADQSLATLKKKLLHSTIGEVEYGEPDGVKSLPITWRKRNMSQALRSILLPEAAASQRRVLTLTMSSTSGNTVAGSLYGRPKHLDEVTALADGMWPVRPRKKPLIGLVDFMLDMPAFRPHPRRTLFDWNSRNMVSVAIKKTVCHFEPDSQWGDKCAVQRFEEFATITAIKWSHEGDKMAVSTLKSTTSVYHMETGKAIWRCLCRCSEEFGFECNVNSIAWSPKNDEAIITGCTGGFLMVYYISKGAKGRLARHAHSGSIYTVTFCPNNRYVASTGFDKRTQIFSWPDLQPYVELGYYTPLKSMAWHPSNHSKLCIGGGKGDGSLSLWDINLQKPLAYRQVDFCQSSVDALTWSERSGELIVVWSFWQDGERHVTVPVLASLDRIVDVVPVEDTSNIFHLAWNPDGTQLGMQLNRTLMTWNFFGDESNAPPSRTREKGGECVSSAAVKNFSHFTIR